MEGEELLPAHCLRDSCRGTRSSHRTPRAGVWDGQGDGGGNCTLIKVIVRRPQPKEAKGCGICPQPGLVLLRPRAQEPESNKPLSDGSTSSSHTLCTTDRKHQPEARPY